MPGLVPGIHVLEFAISKTWMAGTSPAMTKTLVFAANASPSPEQLLDIRELQFDIGRAAMIALA